MSAAPARQLVFDTPARKALFAKIYEAIIDGRNFLREFELRTQPPRPGDDLWARRGAEPRLIRKLKTIGTRSTERFVDERTRQLPVYELREIDPTVTLELLEDEFKCACAALRAASWNTAVADEAEDAIVFFERAAVLEPVTA